MMIYLFENPNGNASIVYDGSTLTAEQKAQAVAVESLPTAETPSGKIAILKVSKTDNRVWYEYEDAPKNDEIEALRFEMARNNTEMFDAVLALMGGM